MPTATAPDRSEAIADELSRLVWLDIFEEIELGEEASTSTELISPGGMRALLAMFPDLTHGELELAKQRIAAKAERALELCRRGKGH